MFKRNVRILLAASLLLIVALVAGCGGGSGLQRVAGLSATETVTTFFDAAKNNRMEEASLYVSAASKSDPKTVVKFMTGQSELTQIKNSNIMSIKQVAQQGNYAALLVTTQEQNTFKINMKPVGLEKVNGEWYIIDFDQIYTNAKYKVLQQLLANI
jgi:hypothetical protein